MFFILQFITNMLSIMTITRERQPDYTGWKAGGGCDPCVGECSGGITVGRGLAPAVLLVFYWFL